MLGIGGVTAMFCFDLDYLMGSVHYGLYLGTCLLGRWLAGVGLLPTDAPSSNPVAGDVTGLNIGQWVESWTACVALFF